MARRLRQAESKQVQRSELSNSLPPEEQALLIAIIAIIARQGVFETLNPNTDKRESRGDDERRRDNNNKSERLGTSRDKEVSHQSRQAEFEDSLLDFQWWSELTESKVKVRAQNELLSNRKLTNMLQ